MRTINVSTDVFAKIWALRQEGEEKEDEILRRVLGVSKQPQNKASEVVPITLDIGGFHDARYDVYFLEGFEIFRFYKGTEYRARATEGYWLLLNNNEIYPSLHKLSQAVVEGNENSWLNWKYDAGEGRSALINEMRDQTKISQRKQVPKLRLEDL